MEEERLIRAPRVTVCPGFFSGSNGNCVRAKIEIKPIVNLSRPPTGRLS